MDSRKIDIGKLGCFSFPAGKYIYTGSAMGPGGIQARLLRHQKIIKKKHWHIDFLRPECEITGILTCVQKYESVTSSVSLKQLECLWSQDLVTVP